MQNDDLRNDDAGGSFDLPMADTEAVSPLGGFVDQLDAYALGIAEGQ